MYITAAPFLGISNVVDCKLSFQTHYVWNEWLPPQLCNQ